MKPDCSGRSKSTPEKTYLTETGVSKKKRESKVFSIETQTLFLLMIKDILNQSLYMYLVNKYKS